MTLSKVMASFVATSMAELLVLVGLVDPLVYQFESETEMTMVLTEVLQLEKSRLQASVMDVSTAPTGFEQKVETVAEDSLAQTGMD